MTYKIYKIIPCDETADENDVYYGSTLQPINDRFRRHKSDYIAYLLKLPTSFKLASFKLFDKYGFANCKIVLVEELDKGKLKYDAVCREADFIETHKCVNENNPRPWDKKKAEEIYSQEFECECGDTYTYKHKARHMTSIRHRMAVDEEFRLQKEAELAEKQQQSASNLETYKKNYYETNKTRILETATQKYKDNTIICADCGGNYVTKTKERHLKSGKHLLATDAEFKAKREAELKAQKERNRAYKADWYQKNK